MAQVQRKQIQNPLLSKPKPKPAKTSIPTQIETPKPQEQKPQETTEQSPYTGGFKITKPKDNTTEQEEKITEESASGFKIAKPKDNTTGQEEKTIEESVNGFKMAKPEANIVEQEEKITEQAPVEVSKRIYIEEAQPHIDPGYQYGGGCGDY